MSESFSRCANARPRVLLCVLLVLTFAPAVVVAEEEPNPVRTSAPHVDLDITGTFQPRFSYGTSDDVDRVGFGVRRARLRATATFDRRVGVHYDVDVRGGGLESVDLYAFYRWGSAWRVRVGYLAGAQPEAYIPTSHTRIDGIDRAAIGERWSDITIGSRGRDFGVDVRRRTDRTRVELWLHNGDGNFDPGRGNFRQSISDGDATRGVDRTDMAVSAAAGWTPAEDLEIGGFASYNANRGPYTAVAEDARGRSYGSWSAHVYWGADPGDRPVRLKAEVLGVNFESGEDGEGGSVPARDVLGWALFGAVAPIDHGELFVRYEEFDADDGNGADAYVTAGASYSRSAANGHDYREERITLAYTNAVPGADGAETEHLVVLQWQWVY